MRLFSRTLLTALATVAALVAVPGPGTVPSASAAATSFEVEGVGWGHGIGMSQYGAQGAAKQGQNWRQILGFYYPGTKVGTAGGSIRVAVTEARSRLVVHHRSGLRVRSVRTGTSYRLTRSGARRWRITASADNATSRIWVYTRSWHLVRSLRGEAEFTGSPLTLSLPSGPRVYRGRLRSAIHHGHRDVVNIVGLDAYVRGVVPREMPASWHPQALRAQAVAARTYAVHERETTDRGHFDVYDDTRSQVYGGASAEQSATNEAVVATRGEIRTYGGKPAFTQFSSSNGGWTVQGSQPYLKAQADPYDPVRPWHWTLTQAELAKAAPNLGTVTGVTVVKRDGNGPWGGRVLTVRITGTRGQADVDGNTFRSRIGLLSTLFRRV